MRVAGAIFLVFFSPTIRASAEEPTSQELLLAVERQLRVANVTAGPSVGCVVVSKSDRYPKVADSADKPGRLGGYDRDEFRKLNPGEERLGVSLDLADPKNVPDHGYSCGVVIDASGLVLTPYHVIEGATKIYVHLPGRTGSYADIHAADARHDLAVLKLIAPPEKLTPIKFADVRIDNRNGQRPNIGSGKLVVLMANAYVTGFPIDKPSAALGGLTNVRHRTGSDPAGGKKAESYYNFGTFLEHDAKLNAGVSGAALLNLDGEMVGLTTTQVAVVGGGATPHYAFPVDESFRRVVEVLHRGEEVDYGFLGVTLSSAQTGIAIGSVTTLGPAAQAGIEGGDIVTQINGATVTSYDELLLHIGSALAGAKVKLTVSRSGRERDVTVTLGKLRHDQPFLASVRPEPVFGLRVEYGSILAQKLPMEARPLGNGVPAGVSVREIAANSPAATEFKKLGDRPERWLITAVNGTPVNTPAEFYKAAKGQQSLKLTVLDPTELNRKDREVTLP